MSEARVPRESLPDPVGKLRVVAGRTAVCVVRIGERYFAVNDRCTHADVSLTDGEIDAEECSIECWKHGSAFSLLDGEPQSLPATVPVAVYDVRVEGDDLIVVVP